MVDDQTWRKKSFKEEQKEKTPCEAKPLRYGESNPGLHGSQTWERDVIAPTLYRKDGVGVGLGLCKLGKGEGVAETGDIWGI